MLPDHMNPRLQYSIYLKSYQKPLKSLPAPKRKGIRINGLFLALLFSNGKESGLLLDIRNPPAIMFNTLFPPRQDGIKNKSRLGRDF